MAERQTRNAVDVDFAGSTPANRIIMCDKCDQIERLFWHEGELTFSEGDLPTEEERAHAEKVIEKIFGGIVAILRY